MKAFLKTVAQDMLAKYGTNTSDIAVVFPNKRAALFLNTYLAQLVSKPIWTPIHHHQRPLPPTLRPEGC